MIVFASLFAFGAWHAVKTGRIRPSVHDRVYWRSVNPGTFWFHVGVYVLVALAFLFAAAAWA